MFQGINKQRKIAIELFKKRVSDQESKCNTVVNGASLQIIGDGSQGTSKSFMLNSGTRSYLFNCGAGLQRLCHSHKIKLIELQHIFLTNLSCDNIAGIFGVALTMQDLGIPSVCVHSSAGITGLFESLDKFTVFNSGIIRQERVYPPGYYMDNYLRVEPIVINNPTVDVQGEENTRTNKSIPLLSYICRLPDIPGHLDPAKCREFKVPIGPMLALLKAGQDITLKDGSIVKSSEVCGPQKKGTRFLVLECPSLEHLSWLEQCKKLNELKVHDNEKKLDIIIHLTPSKIANSKQYQEWLRSFHESRCKHLLCSDEISDRIIMVDMRRNQYLLHKLDDQIFPFPHFEAELQDIISLDSKDTANEIQNNPEITTPETKELKYIDIARLEELGEQTEVGSLDKLFLRPDALLKTPKSKIDLEASLRKVYKTPSFCEILEKLKCQQKSFSEPKFYEPELSFLGTGSAVPSKYRNTSGILINLIYPKPASIMLDCAEDSYGQMIRLYGYRRTNEILKNLKFIFISHQHADHHVGLCQVIKKRSELTKEPVILLIPPKVDSFLRYYESNIEDLTTFYKIFRSDKIFSDPTITQYEVDSVIDLKSSLYESLSDILVHIDLIKVDHCPDSCASVMTFNINHGDMKTFKVAYSGDCRPSDEFARYGRHSDLLIHEATFDDRGQVDANLKKHCTTSEAISVAKQMKAKFTILTHFSQRFAKIPIFTSDFDDTIGFGMDFMKIRCPSHFVRLPALKPILNIAYKEQLDIIESKYTYEDEKKLLMSSMQGRVRY